VVFGTYRTRNPGTHSRGGGVCSRNGYQKTTVADIAKGVRMSPAKVIVFDSEKAINEGSRAAFDWRGSRRPRSGGHRHRHDIGVALRELG